MSEYDESVTDKVLTVYELAKIGDFLDDEDVRSVLVKVVKIIQKPEVPANKAAPMMLKLQALAFEFKAKGKYYMLQGKGEKDASIKKNHYLSLADEIDKLVSVLKYITKVY
jgi:hypothetical protein